MLRAPATRNARTKPKTPSPRRFSPKADPQADRTTVLTLERSTAATSAAVSQPSSPPLPLASVLAPAQATPVSSNGLTPAIRRGDGGVEPSNTRLPIPRCVSKYAEQPKVRENPWVARCRNLFPGRFGLDFAFGRRGTGQIDGGNARIPQQVGDFAYLFTCTGQGSEVRPIADRFLRRGTGVRRIGAPKSGLPAIRAPSPTLAERDSGTRSRSAAKYRIRGPCSTR